MIERSGSPSTCAGGTEPRCDSVQLPPPAPRVNAVRVPRRRSLVVAADIPAQWWPTPCAGAGDQLEDIALFDVFTNVRVSTLPPFASCGFCGAPDRTSTEEHASAACDAAVQSAAKRVGAVLRG